MLEHITYHVCIWSVLIATSVGSLVQFYQIVRHIGGLTPSGLTLYGCYCGYGSTNNGKVVDCLDMCCFHHDNCFEGFKGACPYEYSFFTFASYELNETFHCDPDQEECRLKLCMCDYEFGVCVGKYRQLHKERCTAVRDETVCTVRQANYTQPDCANADINDMIEQTRDICPEKVVPTTPNETTASTTQPTTMTTSQTGTTQPSSTRAMTVQLTTSPERLRVTNVSYAANLGWNVATMITADVALMLSLFVVLTNPVLLP